MFTVLKLVYITKLRFDIAQHFIEEPRSEKMGNADGVCRQARPSEGSPGSNPGLTSWRWREQVLPFSRGRHFNNFVTTDQAM